MKVMTLSDYGSYGEDKVVGVFNDPDFMPTYIYNHFDEFFGEGERDDLMKDCNFNSAKELFDYLDWLGTIYITECELNPI